MSEIDPVAELALELAALVGDFCAVIEWCVEHEGECLGDHPARLDIAKRTLAKARKYLEDST